MWLVLKPTSFRAYVGMAYAYDQINYSRHFSYHWATHQQLHLTHPAIYHEFIKCYFSVKRTRGNFNKLPPYKVIEQTINKEQKGSRGIIGISTSDGAVQRWILPTHIIAGLAANLKESINLAARKNAPNDLGKKRIENDEKVVHFSCSITKSWQNSFEYSQKNCWSFITNWGTTIISKRFDECSNNWRE